MTHFTLSLAVGAVVGAADVFPMLFQRLPFRSCAAMFLVCLFTSVLVFHGDLPYLPWWADGMAVMLMLLVPVLLAFPGRDRRGVPVMLCNALLFGFLISAAEHYL